MAQYVLLRIEEDQEAQTLVEDIIGYQGPLSTPSEENEVHATVVAQYKVPTKFCQCGDASKNIPHNRGAKYGWYLCPHCGLPAPHFGQSPMNILPLEEEAKDPAYQTHVLNIYPGQSIGKARRIKALALIQKAKAAQE